MGINGYQACRMDEILWVSTWQLTLTSGHVKCETTERVLGLFDFPVSGRESRGVICNNSHRSSLPAHLFQRV